MRLTSFTDYTLRSLIFLGMHRDALVTIQDIADTHNISKNHLTKVIHQLGVNGLVDTVRGRNGGLRLKREPADINIGAVVRGSETDFFMAECFDQANNTCALDGDCYLKFKLKEATEAFLKVLDGVTLEQLLSTRRAPGAPQAVLLHAMRQNGNSL
ncbi:RrF2 family transcriptional regulator [Pseudoduganella namucuonensis]|uniref:Transcriptional regulator, BadM/Rrf2 family n=1 Tax=Pseudoduganella namucuonensis TaxID=1035707 RepID=A0A1I7GW50_9BURK|nr:Rrf2 family transcriptional regulator [Pseudoduganella namucuonensis]SFU52649.1 transcriptional regulator, BadM/Rrf2 family [Pseudoduganella namucuonensis]